MQVWLITTALCGASVLVASSPALARVQTVAPQGFEVVEAATVNASADKLYELITEPSRWWSSEHTYSGSAANLVLAPHAGGCFCEKLKDDGSVQHMTVTYAAPGQALRLRGALGPLQGEGADGALTFTLKPSEGETALSVSYVVGGYLRKGPAYWAPLVDKVLNEQIARLKRYAETRSPEITKP